jgi:hypothetical protein
MSTQVRTRSQLMVEEFMRYEDAERAVDRLADNNFPVEHVTVVGCDLRLVETVYGRLTWFRAGLAGVVTGAWIGLFVGALVAMWARSTSGAFAIMAGSTGYGVLFGAIFALIAYALTGDRHGYISRSQIVPGKYELLADADFVEPARRQLNAMRQDL